MKVDVFIVGAPKAGTTSLHHYLNEHPDIMMSKEKEPDYFSAKELSKQGLYYGSSRVVNEENYHNLFSEKKDETHFGESSVSYLFYPEIAQRIKEYNPNSKIIIMLRDPIQRAFSHYLMDYKLGLISDSFDDVYSHKNGLNFQQYFELGNYFSQVKRYFDSFGKENVHIIWYSNFKTNSELEIRKVFNFLNVKMDIVVNYERIHNSFLMPKNNFIRKIYSVVFLRKILSFIFPSSLVETIKSSLFNKGNKPKLSDESRIRILEYYLNDIENLEQLLLVNLDRWKK